MLKVNVLRLFLVIAGLDYRPSPESICPALEACARGKGLDEQLHW